MLTTTKIPRVIGHRGAKGFAPENTITSFRKAKEIGANWVEFDVKETEDGVLIIMHDDDLDRTTNGSGKLISKKWEAIKNLDAGSWFSSEFKNEKIPTFDQTISVLGQLNLGANVEIKPCPSRETRTAIAIANEIKNKWPKNLPKPIVSSFSMESLLAAKKIEPNLIIGALFEKLPPDWKKIAKEVKAQTIHLDHEIVTKELIMEIQGEGYPILTYTVNDQTRANYLFELGVSAVFTDYPWKE
ncbi:glycerophosphoryl diester phosphodiesterase [Pigmentibacter sp. JX0631]|uniref:glycerophosphoryl diester phosphodiesterase n=1 Tax=Pigmentibacter sp. JX0631 TaxID=2976982 RepID=UPI002468A568|nr:glycerophosphoryl diester phosphodiesterase [Pigmentibacter sp. JX0631]WGL61344.1 glycerophosphoryl diester phosphodiesterase [Pigmentibacter sp. JX0631]